jgi:1,4-alpha-glucan branching enzyme
MDYQSGTVELDDYLTAVNALLADRGQPRLEREQLAIPINQLKAFVDVCHLYGLAVLFDVVYNHAGGQVKGQDESIYFFDREAGTGANQSQFFLPVDYSGGPSFAVWKEPVRQFLIDNACFFAKEYHADGFRYDQVSAIVQTSANDSWRFFQALTDTVRAQAPSCIQVAEYWNVDPYVVKASSQGGAGFDATWNDGLRNNIHAVLGQAAGGQYASVNLDGIMSTLRAGGFDQSWKAVQHVENQDSTYFQHPSEAGRIAAMADPSGNHRSWYVRSRSRVATGLILAAPGIPLIFMGQEFLEDKRWSDNPANDAGTLLWWDGLDGADKAMGNHYRFTSELCWLRRRHPALRGEGFAPVHGHNINRVIAFQRWVEGVGRDVMIVASFNETTQYGYLLGFPYPGRWLEVFNSDVYDNWVNPWCAGNGGSIDVNQGPRDNLNFSASIVIPANSLLVFARDQGD